MITVSTIIPSFNAAAYIGQSVQSALNQRDVRSEVIVVDDGSTDDTLKVLGQFNGAIRILHQPHGGPCRARNRGAAFALGEWLAFLDADDEWLPGKLSAQLSLASTGTGLIYSERINVGSQDRVSERQSACQTLYDGDIFESLLLDNFITTSSVLMRRMEFQRLQGFVEGLRGCEDWDLWLRYSAEAPVTVCRQPLVRYRWHSSGLSNNLNYIKEGQLQVLDRALSLPRARSLHWLHARRARAGAWANSAWHARSISRGVALCWNLRSALYWPWRASVFKEIMRCCLGVL